MPRGTIIENLGRGLYKIKIHGDLTRLKASLANLENKLSGLEVEIERWVDKEEELYDKKENMEIKVSDAQDAYDNNEITVAQYSAVLQAAVIVYSEYWACKRHLTALEYQFTSLNAKRLRWLSATSSFLDGKEIRNIWCADYKIDLEINDSVGIILYTNELRSGMVVHPHHGQKDYSNLPSDWVVDPKDIRTIWDTNSYYSPLRDGTIQPTVGAGDSQNFVNVALLPAWQRWMPMYRAGTIKTMRLQYVDTSNITSISIFYLMYWPITASVELNTDVSSAQGLDINPGQHTTQWISGTRRARLKRKEHTTLAIVPFDYYGPIELYGHIPKPGMAFRLNDKILMAFKNYDWNRGHIIGFQAMPRLAAFSVKILRKGLPDYEVLGYNEEVEVTHDACTYSASKGWTLYFTQRDPTGRSPAIFQEKHIRVGDIISVPKRYDNTFAPTAVVAAVDLLGGDFEEGTAYGFLLLTSKRGTFYGGGASYYPMLTISVNDIPAAYYEGPPRTPLRPVYANMYMRSKVKYMADVWYHVNVPASQYYNTDLECWCLVMQGFPDGGFFLFAQDIPRTICTQYPNRYKTEDLFNKGSVPCLQGNLGVYGDILNEYNIDVDGLGPEGTYIKNRRDFFSGKTVNSNFGDRITDDQSKLYTIHMEYWDFGFMEVSPEDTRPLETDPWLDPVGEQRKDPWFTHKRELKRTVYTSVPFDVCFARSIGTRCIWIHGWAIDYETAIARACKKHKYTIFWEGKVIGKFDPPPVGGVTVDLHEGNCYSDYILYENIYRGYWEDGLGDPVVKLTGLIGGVEVFTETPEHLLKTYQRFPAPGTNEYIQSQSGFPTYPAVYFNGQADLSGVDVIAREENVSPGLIEERCSEWTATYSSPTLGTVWWYGTGRYNMEVQWVHTIRPTSYFRAEGFGFPEIPNMSDSMKEFLNHQGFNYSLASWDFGELTHTVPPAFDRHTVMENFVY